jgi:transposase-like protein
MQTGHTFKADRTAQIIQLVIRGELTPTRAAKKLGISRRHVYRLRDRMLESPETAIKSRRKGRPGSGLPPEFRAKVIDLVRSHYADFGPTLAAEKLAERHGINVSREWLRLAMIRAGIWQDRLDRMPRVHQLRAPCECRGELVQIDGSHHRWFEYRGPKCALLVFIDDATSEILHLEFAPSESSFAYMQAMLRYVQRHGRPVAIYSDKHTVFRKSAPNPERNSEPTQFGRSLERLQIGMINAETAQAKGRVERANRTLQDRLIKEMRLAGISCIADANAFVQSYIDLHNAKFARPPASLIEAHRPLPCNINLQDVFRRETECTLSKSLQVNYDKRIFILDPSRDARALVGKVVTLCEYPDGRVTIEYNGQSLLISKTFDKLTRIQPQIVDGKLLHQALDEIRQEQALVGDIGSPLPFQTAVEEHMASALQVALSLNIEPHHRKRNGNGPSRLGHVDKRLQP